MKYLLMIYTAESVDESMSEQDMTKLIADYSAFSADLVRSGKMLGGERLRPVKTATTVRVRNGDATTTDGPFAETKEQLGGFYLIEAADLDEAVAWAKRIPSAAHGSIEVRPIWEMDSDSA